MLSFFILTQPVSHIYLLYTQQIFLVLIVSPNYHALVFHTHPTRLTYIFLIYSTNVPSSPYLSYHALVLHTHPTRLTNISLIYSTNIPSISLSLLTIMLSSFILTQPVSQISLNEHLKSLLLTNPDPFHLPF